jgi:hypothetical protein
MSVVIESGFTGTTYALTNPRIAGGALAGTVAVSTEATGYDGDNAADGTTYTAWKPTAMPATWTLTFTSAAVSYVGIAAHDLGSRAATVNVQRWTGAAWSTVATATPANDNALLFLLTRRTAQTTFRVEVTGSSIPMIGIIAIGDVLEMPQKCVWTDSLPFNEAMQVTYADAISEGGNVLGRFLTRRARPCSMTVNNISETWWATNGPTLAGWLEDGAVFVADRPSVYAASVIYGQVPEPLQAPRVGPLDAARSMTITVTGYETA